MKVSPVCNATLLQIIAIRMWSFEIKMTKFEEFRKAGGQDEALLLEIMNNCEIIEEIIEKESDSFDFTIEIGGE